MKTKISGLRYAWLVTVTNALQQVGMTKVLEGCYRREYLKDSVLEKENIDIHCISRIAGMYRVCRFVLRRKDPKNDNIWEVEETALWKAVYNTATRQLQRVGCADQSCCFIPEQMVLLFENNEYIKYD